MPQHLASSHVLFVGETLSVASSLQPERKSGPTDINVIASLALVDGLDQLRERRIAVQGRRGLPPFCNALTGSSPAKTRRMSSSSEIPGAKLAPNFGQRGLWRRPVLPILRTRLAEDFVLDVRIHDPRRFPAPKAKGILQDLVDDLFVTLAR